MEILFGAKRYFARFELLEEVQSTVVDYFKSTTQHKED